MRAAKAGFSVISVQGSDQAIAIIPPLEQQDVRALVVLQLSAIIAHMHLPGFFGESHRVVRAFLQRVNPSFFALSQAACWISQMRNRGRFREKSLVFAALTQRPYPFGDIARPPDTAARRNLQR